MSTNAHDQRPTQDHIIMARPSRRRTFLRLMGDGVIGATAAATGLGSVGQASASVYDPLWSAAQVFVGSSSDQVPGPSITCPMSFANGHFANASHSLDLSNVSNGEVLGSFTYQNETIHADFSHDPYASPPSNVAAAITTGNDGVNYLLVAGEGPIGPDPTGYFTGVTSIIVRCKYKVLGEDLDTFQGLIACVYCVAILIRH